MPRETAQAGERAPKSVSCSLSWQIVDVAALETESGNIPYVGIGISTGLVAQVFCAWRRQRIKLATAIWLIASTIAALMNCPAGTPAATNPSPAAAHVSVVTGAAAEPPAALASASTG